MTPVETVVAVWAGINTVAACGLLEHWMSNRSAIQAAEGRAAGFILALLIFVVSVGGNFVTWVASFA